jgi:ATP-dependent Clp protease ATP-binding subunit ClpC
MMFERFTDEARKAVVHAQEESRLLNYRHIGAEHLLLGLLHDGSREQATVATLTAEGVTLAAARQKVGLLAPPAPAEPAGHIPFTPEAKKSLEYALHASNRLRQSHIATAHLLLGVLQAPDSQASQVLAALGADLDRLARAAEDVAAGSEPGDRGQRPVTIVSAGSRDGTPRPPTVARLDAMTARVQRLILSRRRYIEALKRYGRHETGCDPDQGCSCGLGPVLDDTADG